MGILDRKTDHLELCATDAVAFKSRTTLLEEVRLMHQSLPELALSDIDTSVTLLGKKLRAPIVIAGMTGGTDRAGEVNQGLARIAEQRGYGFGLGSQRAMWKNPDVAESYRVRSVAPKALVLGNIGVVQAREMGTADIQSLVRDVGADALCVHMNPAMEMIQPEGDRDFRGGVETYARLVSELGVPVVAKETGCGISADGAAKLADAGVRTVDVSGAGGTSWVGVETLRAKGAAQSLGEKLWDWGIPTAASVVFAKREGHTVIATGGMKDGVDIARAIALGATAGGLARPVYQAFVSGGEAGAAAFLDQVELELRTIMLLTSARTIADLMRVPSHIGPALREWVGNDR